MSNPFKNLPEDKKIHVGKHFFIIEDNYPVSPGHLLIISNKEKTDNYIVFSKECFCTVPSIFNEGLPGLPERIFVCLPFKKLWKKKEQKSMQVVNMYQNG